MNRTIEVPELAEFDPSRYLDDDAVADYIRLAIEDGDPGLLEYVRGTGALVRRRWKITRICPSESSEDHRRERAAWILSGYLPSRRLPPIQGSGAGRLKGGRVGMRSAFRKPIHQ